VRNSFLASLLQAFVIFVNGAKHCVVRFRQLHALHEQLRRDRGGSSFSLPPFPPKKLMSLSAGQLEERRWALERYLQCLCADAEIIAGVSFNGFLLAAQAETAAAEGFRGDVVNVHLMNGHEMALTVGGVGVMSADDVLEKICGQLEVPDELVHHFGLYLVERRESSGGKLIVRRRLQRYESPHLSQRDSDCVVTLRKA